jgi:hypothetical protein
MKTPMKKAALDWLHARANEVEWLEISRLADDSEACFTYLARHYPDVHSELAKLYPPPSSLEIRFDAPKVSHADIVSGRGKWRDMAAVAAEDEAARLRKLIEGQQIVDCSEYELDGPEIRLQKAGLL